MKVTGGLSTPTFYVVPISFNSIGLCPGKASS